MDLYSLVRRVFFFLFSIFFTSFGSVGPPKGLLSSASVICIGFSAGKVISMSQRVRRMVPAEQEISWNNVTQNYMTWCCCLSSVYRIVPISCILRHTDYEWSCDSCCEISLFGWHFDVFSYSRDTLGRTTKWNGTTWTNSHNKNFHERHTQNHMQSLGPITSVKYAKLIRVKEPFLFPYISLLIFSSLQRSMTDKRI